MLVTYMLILMLQKEPVEAFQFVREFKTRQECVSMVEAIPIEHRTGFGCIAIAHEKEQNTVPEQPRIDTKKWF